MIRDIHLLNPLWDISGSTNRLAGLHDILSPHARVIPWATEIPPPEVRAFLPVRQLDVARGEFPAAGTLVIIGTYFRLDPWIARGSFDRVILVHNSPSLESLLHKMWVLRVRHRTGPVEIVYASRPLARRSLLPGRVEASPIDIEAFAPAVEREANRPWTVGRVSRDHPTKHHPDSPALYRRLAGDGCRVRILGGTCLADFPDWTGHPGIELLPESADPVAGFLHGLDCFIYLTAPDWFETWGRVIFEAMASGLPVIAERRHGYHDRIRHGENGFLVDSPDEVPDIIRRLRDEPGLARDVGRAALETVREMFGVAWREEILEFYLRPGRRA